MMAVIAEGRNFDRDDTLADAKVRGCPALYPLNLEEIGHDQRKLLQETQENIAGAAHEDNKEIVANKLMRSICFFFV